MNDLSSTWTAIDAAFANPWALGAMGAKFFIYVFSLMATGLMLFRVALPKAGDEVADALRSLAIFSVFVAITATILRVLVQAGRLMDDGIAGMLDPEIISISLEGPLGQSTYVRLVGLGFVLIAILVRPLRVPATLFGAFMVAGSFALTGHATREPQWFLAGLITFHLLAVSYWWGALAPLYKLARPNADLPHAADIADKFGKQAIIVVPMLILAGGTFIWMLLGGPQQILATDYGRVFLIKLVFVAGVLAIASLNKLRFVPALANNDEGSALRFRRSLKLETLAFLFIFAATALLTTSFAIPTL